MTEIYPTTTTATVDSGHKWTYFCNMDTEKLMWLTNVWPI